MSDKPKRRFWQFHLSTAVVLMIISAAFLGLNLKSRISGLSKYRWGTIKEETGWPYKISDVEIDYYIVHTETFSSGLVPRFVSNLDAEKEKGHSIDGIYDLNGFRMTPNINGTDLTFPPDSVRRFYWAGVLTNLFAWVLCIAMAGSLIEYAFRRREARRQ